MKKTLILMISALMYLTGTLRAQNVIFITDDLQDSVQIEWLTDVAGYDVTTFWPDGGLAMASTATLNWLNSADLIIIGRSGNSGDFDGVDKPFWNRLTPPLMLVSPWVARNSRLNWFPSGTCVNYGTPDTAWANILMPADPIFAGVTLDGDSLDWMVARHSAIRLNDSVATNAEVLARSMTYDNMDEEFILVARFDPYVEFYPGAGESPAGYRAMFGMGNDENGVINDFPLTENARTVYLAELERMLALPEPAKHIILVHGLDPAVSHDSVQLGWLEDQGYEVTYLPVPSTAGLSDTLALLNAADLVILGRSCPSTTFQPPARALWNSIKAPVLQCSGWGARNSRSNWFNSSSAVNYGAPDTAWANILMPADPIFAGVTLDGDSLDWMIARHSAISVPSTTATNAEVLARGVGADSNYILLARFEPLVEFYPGSGDYPAGYCTYFGFGNDESGVINTFPLTDNAQAVYLAEVEELLAKPKAPEHIILVHGLDPAVSHDSVQLGWLQDQGYSVTYLPVPTLGLGMDTLALLNKADLVILGRSCPSTTFQPPARPYWNAIKSPVIQISGWGARNSRSNWFNSSSAVNYGVPDTAYANVLMPMDEVFADVTLVGDSLDWMVARHSAISVPPATETNADVLARGIGADTNYILFARFDPLVEFYPGSVDYGSGRYTFFGMGNDESGVINTFPLTDNARMVYLAEIQRQIMLPKAPKSDDANLMSLTASEGELTPAFDPAVTEYTLEVAGATVTLTAMAHPNASVAGDGDIDAPGVATITVTADDGSTQDYVVTITSGGTVITEIVVVGDATPNGWNMPSTEPMTQDATNASIFTWEGILISTAAESNLKFATYNSSDWCGQWILATALEQPVEEASGYQLYQGCPPAEEDLKWHVTVDGVYLITIDVENETIEFELLTGIIDNEYSNISVYPNPATSSITVVNAENLSYVAIFNLAGEKVLDLNVENANGIAEVNISELPAGFYVIRAYEDENLIGVGKFTKQ
jgi:hypothetical protein